MRHLGVGIIFAYLIGSSGCQSAAVTPGVLGMYKVPPPVLEAMKKDIDATAGKGEETAAAAAFELVSSMTLHLEEGNKAAIEMAGVRFDGSYEMTESRITVTFANIEAKQAEMRKKMVDKHPGVPPEMFIGPSSETVVYGRSANPDWLFLSPDGEGVVSAEMGKTPTAGKLETFYLSR